MQQLEQPGRTGGWLGLTVLLSAVLPAALLTILGRQGLDFSSALLFILLGVLAVDAALLLAMGLVALRAVHLPPAPRHHYPAASAVVLAERGAPAQALRETVQALLRTPYLSPVQIVVASASEELASAAEYSIGAAEASERARIVRIEDGTPSALFAAALAEVSGSFLGVFVPGQRPQRGVFAQAWIWLSHGCEPLQGAVRADNAGASWAAHLAAVDVVGIDFPIAALPADHLTLGGGMFLTAERARTLIAEPAAPRVTGARDRRLQIEDSVPDTVGGMWRWWVARDTAALASPGRIRAGTILPFYRSIWRPLVVWLTPAVLATAGYRLAQLSPHGGPSIVVPAALLLLLYVPVPALLRTLFAFLLADEELRRHRGWFIAYGIAWMLWLGAVRNSAVRLAQVRLALGRSVIGPGQVSAERREEIGVPQPGPAPVHEEGDAAEEPCTLPDSVSPAVVLSPAARRVLRMAGMLPYVVATMTQELDRGADECVRLRARVAELERTLAEQMAGAGELCIYGSNTIDANALARLQRTMSLLQEHPENVLALSGLAEQAADLASVVDSYSRLRDALDAS